ncbi:MAG: hypothetical protein MJ197_03485 [Bacteroidales bacterium]|nr:hypothetical protein [Bacteroidales bacterium]
MRKEHTSSYLNSFESIVAMIQEARNIVFRVANGAMVELCWKIGQYVSQKIASSEWGERVDINVSNLKKGVYTIVLNNSASQTFIKN